MLKLTNTTNNEEKYNSIKLGILDKPIEKFLGSSFEKKNKKPPQTSRNGALGYVDFDIKVLSSETRGSAIFFNYLMLCNQL